MATQTTNQTLQPASTASSLAAASAAKKTAGLSASRTTIANNFDSFLKLLTTQLQHQDPTAPLDTNQFTQQLVSFASVEQQLRSNDTLNQLLTNVKTSNAANAASYVGMQITADGSTSTMQNGKVSWSINPSRDIVQGVINILDKDGNAVASINRSITGGQQTFTWDGRSSTGTLAPEGDYTIAVTGLDTRGQPVTVKSELSGKVDSVDMNNDQPVLLIGSTRIPLANIKTIGRASSM